MNDVESAENLCGKIARLVRERGWNQEEFARLANLNRLTIRAIFQGGGRRLHNATVSACARTLGLSVADLQALPLETLIARLSARPASPVENKQRLYEQATQPELLSWMERNPDRATQLTPDEMDELLSLQGTGGPMTAFGVAHFVELIERKRRLQDMVATVASTEYIDLLEQFVTVLFEKVQPFRERGK